MSLPYMGAKIIKIIRAGKFCMAVNSFFYLRRLRLPLDLVHTALTVFPFHTESIKHTVFLLLDNLDNRDNFLLYLKAI